MSKDFRLNVSFVDHPKTRKLIKRCGDIAPLCLLRLWSWATLNRPTGMLGKVSDDDLEFIARWNGEEGAFIEACIKIGWIDRTDKGHCELHDWQDNQPWVYNAEKRSQQARKAAAARWEKRTGQDAEGNANGNADSNAESISSKSVNAGGNAKSMQGASYQYSLSNADSMHAASNTGSNADSIENADCNAQSMPAAIQGALKECSEHASSNTDSITMCNAEAPFEQCPSPSPIPTPTPYSGKKETETTYGELKEIVQDFQEDRKARNSKIAPVVTNTLVEESVKGLQKMMNDEGFSLAEVKDTIVWAKDHPFWAERCQSMVAMTKTKPDGLNTFQKIHAQRLEQEKSKTHTNPITYSGDYPDQSDDTL